MLAEFPAWVYEFYGWGMTELLQVGVNLVNVFQLMNLLKSFSKHDLQLGYCCSHLDAQIIKDSGS